MKKGLELWHLDFEFVPQLLKYIFKQKNTKYAETQKVTCEHFFGDIINIIWLKIESESQIIGLAKNTFLSFSRVSENIKNNSS